MLLFENSEIVNSFRIIKNSDAYDPLVLDTVIACGGAFVLKVAGSLTKLRVNIEIFLAKNYPTAKRRFQIFCGAKQHGQKKAEKQLCENSDIVH